MASSSVVSRIASANAQANLHASNLGLNKALTRLSGGLRVESDDAGALAFTSADRQGLRDATSALSHPEIEDGQ
jgi:flagellin-like hook-associated protein FlgL